MEYPEKPVGKYSVITNCTFKKIFLLASFFFFHYFSNAQCVPAGPLEGTNFAIDNSIGVYNFSNPSNASVSDNNQASASALIGILTNDTYYLVITGFGFSIPINKSICGVTVEIERRATGVILTAAVRDNEIKLVKGGLIVGNNKAKAGDWPTSDAISTYGSSSDLWGTVLSRDDVNASDFGIAISARLIALVSALPSAQIDNVRITIDSQDLLPIVLEYFKAGRQDNKAILEWKTSEEENNGSIIIQRSIDSRQWKDIDTVRTYFANINKVYRYENILTEPMKYFFRLKIIENNNNTYYSGIKSVDNRGINTISMHPNPAQSFINIDNVKKGSAISLMNSYGQLVQPVVIHSTGDPIQFSVQHLQKGIYFIRVDGEVYKFIKN